MSIKRKMLSGGMSLGAMNMAVGGMRFGRVLIAANVLSKDDYGIAALFAMTTMLLMAISEMGLVRLIIQNPRGDEDRFGRMIHLLLFGRGVVLALVIFVLAGPIAEFLTGPDVEEDLQWAFEVLALSPLIAGLAHMDVFRFERQLNFKPLVKTTVLASVVITLCTYPLVRYFMDYRALLALGVLQAVCHTALTHVFAERRYRFGFDRVLLPTIYHFGWPILINSVLMMAIVQGEKFIIAHSDYYDEAMLAEFNIAALLTFEAMIILALLADKLLLPVLSQMQDDRQRFLRHYHFYAVIYCGVASGFAAFFSLLGYWLLYFLFGQKYLEASGLVALLGIQQAIRLTRYSPTLVSLALGDSRNSLISNISRVSGVVVCYFIAMKGGSMEGLVVVGIASELVALMVGVNWLKSRSGIGVNLFDKPFALMAMFVVLVGWLGTRGEIAGSLWVSGATFLGVLILIMVMYFVCFEGLRHECLKMAGLLMDRLRSRVA